ncbi:MAG: phenylalanine--tRNA ligase subunit beta, partial [Armatimonadetes bacterium]|nr:phenylalanine--tRNA ligase subunit beta [Armatimonadota bacterium]
MLNIPIHWLKDYVDVTATPEELADLLTRLGIPIEEIHEAQGGLGGAVLVAEVTPNRGDCLSMVGVAREVAAATGAELRLPGAELIESRDESILGRCTVLVEDGDLCPRYAARLVTGLVNRPAPEWMQQRLRACGQRPLNVLVDITNYVLFELGQPLHAFDHTLLGGTVVVRRAQAGEVIVTLDGVKRTLTGEQLLITDGERGVALAGVMGGANTEVSEHTTDVLLEAAQFYGPNIRRTARTLGLESESSYRFARTVDPGLPPYALERAAGLLAAHAGGQVAAGVVDVVAKPIEPAVIRLRPGRCNSFLGTAIPAAQIAGYLTALGLQVEPAGEDLEVGVPTRRPDLTREVDLIEEVARLHGYDNVPTSIPRAGKATGRLSARQRLERRVRELLLGCGLNEVQSFSLT